MSNSQLQEIEASVQSLIRRAYELGRKDALKKMVAAVQSDNEPHETLALMAPKPMEQPLDVQVPAETQAGQTPAEPYETQTMNDTAGSSETPWWARRVR